MSDLIRRKDLYNRLAELESDVKKMIVITPKGTPEYARFHSRLNELTEIKSEVRNVPRVSADPQWIPCSERLPKENGEFLVWYDDGEYMEGCCVVNFDAVVGAFGHWFDEYDEYTLGFLDSEFIYFDEAVA